MVFFAGKLGVVVVLLVLEIIFAIVQFPEFHYGYRRVFLKVFLIMG